MQGSWLGGWRRSHPTTTQFCVCFCVFSNLCVRSTNTETTEWQNATTHATGSAGMVLAAHPCRSPISNLCTDSSTRRVLVKLFLFSRQLQQLKVLACGMQGATGEAPERDLTKELKQQQTATFGHSAMRTAAHDCGKLTQYLGANRPRFLKLVRGERTARVT